MWPNPEFPADLVTFTEEILRGKLRFLCSDIRWMEIPLNERVRLRTNNQWTFTKQLLIAQSGTQLFIFLINVNSI